MFVAQLGRSCRCWVQLKSLCSSAALHYFEFSSVCWSFFDLYSSLPSSFSVFHWIKVTISSWNLIWRVFFINSRKFQCWTYIYIFYRHTPAYWTCMSCVFKSSLLKAWKNWPNFIKLRQRLNLLDPTKALQTSPNTFVAPNKHLCLSVALIGAGMSFKLSGLSKSPVFLTKAAIQTRQMDNCFRGPQMSRFTASAKVN